MVVLLGRMFRWTMGRSWIRVLFLLLVTYILGAVFVAYFEAGNPLATIGNYSWWFAVTITTIGYGDLAPLTTGGRIVAVFIFVLGIGSVGLLITRIADSIVTTRRNRMKGLVQLDLAEHVVIFGYRPKETAELIAEIKGDERFKRAIVLCTDLLDENPFPECVHFVKGGITSELVLERACVGKAGRVVIHGDDDNQSITALLAAYSVNKVAHMVVLLSNPENRIHVQRINPKVECILPLGVLLTVQAFQDPGTSGLFLELIGNNVGTSDLHRLDVPDGVNQVLFGELSGILKERFDALLIAYSESHDASSPIKVNPSVIACVGGGMSIFYISAERIEEISW